MSEEERTADELAAALMAAPKDVNSALACIDVESARALAWAFKRACTAAWNRDPAATVNAADLADALAAHTGDAETEAVAAWTRGMAWLTQGRMEDALNRLTRAGAGFAVLERTADLAQTRISRMIALAMLARHDEALQCGLEARSEFERLGDRRAVVKIDLNLGNLSAQRDRYDEAATHYERARGQLAVAEDAESAVMATRGLAEMRARQHRFDESITLYREALDGATDGGHAVLIAAIEGDLGALDLWRGRYDIALQRLERSRQQYVALAMPHLLAVAEESLADAYAELNLLPEALELYERSLQTYEAAELRTDQAWAQSQRARTLMLLGRWQAAAEALETASTLFQEEDNAVGQALVGVWRAEWAIGRADPYTAARCACEAEPALIEAGHVSWYLQARAVLAIALEQSGDHGEAKAIAAEMLARAESLALPQPRRRARLLLGRLARDRGDRTAAREHYEAAVSSIESLRGSLPGEAFRSAFLGDKLEPYRELVRLSLADGGSQAAKQALAWVERGRARALADQMDDPGGTEPVAAADAATLDTAVTLRERLNACYRQLAHPLAELSADPDRLLGEVRELEALLLEIDRRRALEGDNSSGAVPPASGAVDLDALQRALDDDTVLVEYFALDDALHACIVDAEGFDSVALPLGLAAASQAIEQLRFQTDTLRHGSDRLAHRLPELQRRALHHLQALHAGLWAPLMPRLGARRVVVVPHGVLHYLPFEALHDGQAYEIERRELVRCASAGVLLRCLARPATGFDRALILGHADDRLPQVGREVDRVARLFPGALALRDAAATGAALREHGPTQELLHIACHALFRNDNPRFSALHLADGAFTARDAARLRLRCGLLTLSACETGVSAVMPGDELIGLTHAFLSAGAASVLASLWTVQDETTATLMEAFYTRLRAGARPAAALRETQCEALRRQPHPYFWAAFSLHGRW